MAPPQGRCAHTAWRRPTRASCQCGKPRSPDDWPQLASLHTEVTGCGGAGLTGVDPLGVVADRLGNKQLGANEIPEVFFG